VLGFLKQRIFHAARASGVFNLVAASAWRQRQLLILCYHGTSLDDEHEWNGALYMSPERLRQRFELLKRRGYTVLPLSEALDRLRDGTLPPRAVALTFDDGTYDFFARAVPILREFGFPATVYVPTYYTAFQRPVFDTVISYVAWKGRTRQSCAADGLVEGDAPLDVATPEERETTVARLHASARDQRLDAAGKDDLARRFSDQLAIDYGALLARRVLHLMTPDELRSLPRDLIDVQLHTHRHRTPLDEALFTREIVDNRRELAAILGDPALLRHFCYPSGQYERAFLPWLRAAGVTSATTCDPGLARPAHDPLLLPRFIDTMGQSSLSFEAWISGFAELLPRRTRTALAAHTEC
jgi:peptidoglycan/xylan/chitin deacetylase (PgdA/CDA1 family)